MWSRSRESQVFGGLVFQEPRSEPAQASPCQLTDNALITNVTKWKNLPAAKLVIGPLIRRWQFSCGYKFRDALKLKGGKLRRRRRWQLTPSVSLTQWNGAQARTSLCTLKLPKWWSSILCGWVCGLFPLFNYLFVLNTQAFSELVCMLCWQHSSLLTVPSLVTPNFLFSLWLFLFTLLRGLCPLIWESPGGSILSPPPTLCVYSNEILFPLWLKVPFLYWWLSNLFLAKILQPWRSNCLQTDFTWMSTRTLWPYSPSYLLVSLYSCLIGLCCVLANGPL